MSRSLPIWWPSPIPCWPKQLVLDHLGAPKVAIQRPAGTTSAISAPSGQQSLATPKTRHFRRCSNDVSGNIWEGPYPKNSTPPGGKICVNDQWNCEKLIVFQGTFVQPIVIWVLFLNHPPYVPLKGPCAKTCIIWDSCIPLSSIRNLLRVPSWE